MKERRFNHKRYGYTLARFNEISIVQKLDSLGHRKREKEDIMIKKVIIMLVILSFLSISKAYAYSPEDDHMNQSADIAPVAVLASISMNFHQAPVETQDFLIDPA